MAAFYQKFLRKHLDLSSLSVMRREDNDPYFCTPKGASIFGWAGVDGIHFCFVRGFGETVFAISPMNGGKDCVHVIARDFNDFLRLLLATGDSAALEQAWQWDEAQFDAFLAENPPTDEQKAVLSQISTVFSLTPMERPWQYLRKLQAEFDLSKLKFTEDFYDPEMNPDAPEQKVDWKVYFDGSFWGHHGRERAGREVPVQKWFSWAGRDWFVPSVYVCSKGIVVDFCMRTEASALHGFMKKWGIDPESDESIDFTRDEREQMEREHPLSLGFTPSLTLNGAKLRTSHGCGVIFLPEQPGFCADAEPAMAHYGLDRAYGWSIRRAAFPFVTKRAPKLKSLAVTMTADEVRVPGQGGRYVCLLLPRHRVYARRTGGRAAGTAARADESRPAVRLSDAFHSHQLYAHARAAGKLDLRRGLRRERPPAPGQTRDLFLCARGAERLLRRHHRRRGRAGRHRRGRSGAGEAPHRVLVAALCACRPCRLARRLPRNTVGSGNVRPPLTHFFCDFRYSVGRTPKALWNSVENLLWLS